MITNRFHYGKFTDASANRFCYDDRSHAGNGTVMRVNTHGMWWWCVHRMEFQALRSRVLSVDCTCTIAQRGVRHVVPVMAPQVAIGWVGPRTPPRTLLAWLPHGIHLVLLGAGGGLNPALHVGDIITATALLDAERVDRGRLPVDPLPWATTMAGFYWAPIVTVRVPVRHPAEKRRLYHATGAWCVDMESVRWRDAAVALSRTFRFSVVRWILDTAGEKVSRRPSWWQQRMREILETHADRIAHWVRGMLDSVQSMETVHAD